MRPTNRRRGNWSGLELIANQNEELREEEHIATSMTEMLLEKNNQRKNCPRCLTDKCNRKTGVCDECNPGYLGPKCDIVCPQGAFGVKCQGRCPLTCELNACNHVNGACLDGCGAGFSGDYCNETCSVGYFGKNCVGICSYNCIDSACYPASGQCYSCVIGRTGSFCEKKSLSNAENMSSEFIAKSILGIIALGISFWTFLGFLVFVKNVLVKKEIKRSGKLPPRWVTRHSNYRGMIACVHGRKIREAQHRSRDKEKLLVRDTKDSKTSVASSGRKSQSSSISSEKNKFSASIIVPSRKRSFANKPRFPRKGGLRFDIKKDSCDTFDVLKSHSDNVQISNSMSAPQASMLSISEFDEGKSHLEGIDEQERTLMSLSSSGSKLSSNIHNQASYLSRSLAKVVDNSQHIQPSRLDSNTDSGTSLEPIDEDSFRSEETTGDNVSDSVFSENKSSSSAFPGEHVLTVTKSKSESQVKIRESKSITSNSKAELSSIDNVRTETDKVSRGFSNTNQMSGTFSIISDDAEQKHWVARPVIGEPKTNGVFYETKASGEPSSAFGSPLVVMDLNVVNSQTSESFDTSGNIHGILDAPDRPMTTSYKGLLPDFKSSAPSGENYQRVVSDAKKDAFLKSDENIQRIVPGDYKLDEIKSALSLDTDQSFPGSDVCYNKLKYINLPRKSQTLTHAPYYCAYSVNDTSPYSTRLARGVAPCATIYHTGDVESSSTSQTVSSDSSTSASTRDDTTTTTKSYKESDYSSPHASSSTESTASSEGTARLLKENSSDTTSALSTTVSRSTESTSTSKSSVVSLDLIKKVTDTVKRFGGKPVDDYHLKNAPEETNGKPHVENSTKKGVDKATETLPRSALKTSKTVKWRLTSKFSVGDSPGQKDVIGNIETEKEKMSEKQEDVNEGKEPMLQSTRYFSGTFLMSRFALWETRERGETIDK